MLKQPHEEREGVLLRRLRDAGQMVSTRPGGFGFATGVDSGARRRPVAVVARLTSGSRLADDVRTLEEAGVDGIEIEFEGRSAADEIASTVAAVAVPCGVYVTDAASVVAVEGITGLDWIHLDTAAPARLLGGKGPTRLISLSPDLPPGRLPGLAGLHADAVVVDGRGPFTVETFLAVHTIQGATKGPLLVASGLGLMPDDVRVLHDHGVEGVLVTGASEARAFIAAIEEL